MTNNKIYDTKILPAWINNRDAKNLYWLGSSRIMASPDKYRGFLSIFPKSKRCEYNLFEYSPLATVKQHQSEFENRVFSKNGFL